MSYTRPPVSGKSLLALENRQLLGYVKRNFHATGDRQLKISDWDKLSSDEQNRLSERLKVHQLTISPRLRQFAWEDADSSEIRNRNKAIEEETKAYHSLRKDGGCPLYPIDDLEYTYSSCLLKNTGMAPHRISNNKSWNVISSDNPMPSILKVWIFQKLLHVWRPLQTGPNHLFPDPPEEWAVFQRQWRRWVAFRIWQNDNRRRKDMCVNKSNDGKKFDDYRSIRERQIEVDKLPRDKASGDELHQRWKSMETERERQFKNQVEKNCPNGFQEYANAVRLRLKKHGFTQSFELEEDPKKQDKLTTWIEYLNFEYWWLDHYTQNISITNAVYSKKVENLVAQKIFNSYDQIDQASTDERYNKIKAIWNRIQQESFELDKIQRESFELDKRGNTYVALLQTHEATKAEFQEAKKEILLIGECVDAKVEWVNAEKDAARQRDLLPWVLEQIPMIKAELIQTETVEVNKESDLEEKNGDSKSEQENGDSKSEEENGDFKSENEDKDSEIIKEGEVDSTWILL